MKTEPVKMTPELEKRIQAILDGQVPPPNEMVEYLVEQAQTIHGELVMLNERIGQARQQVQNLERAQVQTQGAANKNFLDLAAWLDRKPKAEAPPKLAAVEAPLPESMKKE